MPKLNFNTNDFLRNLITRACLIAVTVLLIVSFLPHDEHTGFRYDVGKPWMHAPLIAKFDFPVYKSDEALEAERDSVLRLLQPYYTLNSKVEETNVAKFWADCAESMPHLSAETKRIIADRLHRLYEAGIMSMADHNEVVRDSVTIIRVVDGKTAQPAETSCLYSTLSAYEQLLSDEKLAPQRQLLARCNLTNYIEPNLTFDRTRTETERTDALSGISQASGMVLSGQEIIDRGKIVTSETARVLNSLERETKRRSDSTQGITIKVIGQVIFVTILILLYTIYLALFRRDYFEKPRSITMLYMVITVFPIIVSFMVSHSLFSIYIVPFAIAPIFVRVFMDSRTAFITHVVMVLLCAAAVKYQYEFIIIQLVAGLVAIYSLRELSNRAQVFKSAILVTLASWTVYFALQLMQEDDVFTLDRDMYIYMGINGVLLLLAYPLMYLIEKMFGFTSNVTLFELSNTNRGLLRDLSEIAPGTFQHSITVGNLAAEIANRIGANSLLVRTGALYHDIGKMTNPVFFTENQAGVNPHDNMPYEESARIVINHVREGVKMAEKAGVPSIIKNFILTHHGTGVTKYFYIKYKNEHPDEEVDKSLFSYPGPNPFTREQAILMMADTVEAASRSLPEYTEETIAQLVGRLIDQQVDDGYFHECPITFRDIAQAKAVLIERLKAIYHTRIQYPSEAKKEETKDEAGEKKK